MKTVLFLTDFSSSALYALKYTAGFCNETAVSKLILYHSYEISRPEMIMITDVLVPLPSQLDELKTEANKNFRNLDHVLAYLLNKGISIEYITDDRSLIKAIDEITDLHNVDLVVIGLTGSGNEGKNIVGRNTWRIMNEVDTSLMIIPENAFYTGIESCMLAYDLRSTVDRLPVLQLKEMLKRLHSRILVVNVDQKESLEAYRYILEERALHDLLEDVNPEFYYIDHKNKVEALIDFAKQKNVDLIITVYRKQGLLEQFFHNSTNQKLAVKSTIPLLILHKN